MLTVLHACNQAKWAIGMLAPLDEAIQVATEGKAELRPRKLVQGLPAELVKACLELSPAKFASARVSPAAQIPSCLREGNRTILTRFLRIFAGGDEPTACPQRFMGNSKGHDGCVPRAEA